MITSVPVMSIFVENSAKYHHNRYLSISPVPMPTKVRYRVLKPTLSAKHNYGSVFDVKDICCSYGPLR